MRKYLTLLLTLAPLTAFAGPTSNPSGPTPWSLLVQAGSLPAVDSPRSSDMEYAPYPPYSKQWRDMAWDSEQQNAQQLTLLREARVQMENNGKNAGVTGMASLKMPATRPTDALVREILNPLSSLRNLANIVSDGAIFSHLNGNDAEAIGRVRDNFNIADCIRQTSYIVSQLVAAGIEALGCSNANGMAPELRLAGANSIGPRQQTKEAIAWLLDEEPIRQGWRATFRNELANQPASDAGARTAIWSRQEVDRDLPLLTRACDFQDLPASDALLKKCGPLVGIMYLDRMFLTEFRVLSDRRMTAIDLAVQLYRADHGGNWPGNLQALVPDYLPAIPRDPFRGDGAAIGYKIIPHGWADGRDRPLVFVDAGADIPQLGNYPRLGWYASRKKAVRQYRDLSPAQVGK